MKTCRSCGSSVLALIFDIEKKLLFCHECAPRFCPTLVRSPVYTDKDIALLKSMGIDAGTGRIEQFLRERRNELELNSNRG